MALVETILRLPRDRRCVKGAYSKGVSDTPPAQTKSPGAMAGALHARNAQQAVISQ